MKTRKSAMLKLTTVVKSELELEPLPSGKSFENLPDGSVLVLLRKLPGLPEKSRSHYHRELVGNLLVFKMVPSLTNEPGKKSSVLVSHRENCNHEFIRMVTVTLAKAKKFDTWHSVRMRMSRQDFGEEASGACDDNPVYYYELNRDKFAPLLKKIKNAEDPVEHNAAVEVFKTSVVASFTDHKWRQRESSKE